MKIPNPLKSFVEKVGEATLKAITEFGYGANLLGEGVYFLLMGKRKKQKVRSQAILSEMIEMGLHAVPIITVMNATIGVMLAIQGIYSLKLFGAENQVVLGLGFSVVREFAPLITAILVAGRSGSALAARLGTMKINQEIDALTVMGINPVRYLVSPPLIALFIMLPILTLYADFVGLLSAGLYVSIELGISLQAYAQQLLDTVGTNDINHGLFKSLIFAVLITIIGVLNGALVEGGAEGVGKMTTRSVVHAISAIVIADMIVVYISTRW